MTSITKEEKLRLKLINKYSLNVECCPNCGSKTIKERSNYTNFSSSCGFYFYETHIIKCDECYEISGYIYRHPDYTNVMRYEIIGYDKVFQIYKIKRLADDLNSMRSKEGQISYLARMFEDNKEYLCVANFEKGLGHTEAHNKLLQSKFNNSGIIDIDNKAEFQQLSCDWIHDKMCFKISNEVNE